MELKSPNSLASLVDGELVDDRSLDALDADAFRHADFVKELAGMVCRAKTPSNIALFGAWGSGKSSIANLLRKELPSKKSELRFVVFDASKYAEAPLRRHFISQVASELEIDDDKYHHGLYTGTETRDVRFRAGEWLKLGWAFLASVALALAILLVIAVIVAALSAGPFGSKWSNIVQSYLLAALPVAAVITAFVKLAGDGFHITTTQSAPSGDEEFERLFRDLVSDAKTRRLVVFIDELDRCSPEQVASTLETLKTFLFVGRCIFVVAADQQVLEQALRRKARQHTPEDVSNPYYSAGSSYLDKVFQFQLTLPPLRAPALSRFALSLVEDRTGVWQRVPNLDEVVPVLIPTHVVSPRRVKVLLNRFAITYRLAERRVAEGRLGSGLAARATELAKLVCLQSEFPLFAEDLTLDARLPELVRIAGDGDGLPENVRPEVKRRAVAYAAGKRIVAELITAAEPTPASDGALRTPPSGRSPSEDGQQEGAEEVDAAPASGEREGSRADDVARQHAQQLVAYLRKTRHVAGPGPDLVYLESAGTGHGIDAVLAERLQRAALDNDAEQVLALVGDAAGDGQGRGALLVLSDVVRGAQPGIEGRNVVSALLEGIERSGVALDGDADYIADAVAGHLARAELHVDDLLGALALARSSSRDIGPALYKAALEHPESVDKPQVALALLDSPPELTTAVRGRLTQAAAAALLAEPEQATVRLRAMPPEVMKELLASTARPLKAKSDAHYAAVDAQTEGKEADEDDVLDPAPHHALTTAYDNLQKHDGHQRDGLPLDGTGVGQELIRLMLALDRKECRNAVVRRLHDLAPITEPRLAAAVLSATSRRVVSDWPAWLGNLDSQVIGRDQGLQEWVDSLAVTLWQKMTGDTPPAEEETAAALDALGRCAEHGGIDNDLRGTIEKVLRVPLTTDVAADAQDALLDKAQQLAGAGLLGRTALADIALSAVAQTLAATMETVPASQRTKIGAVVAAWVRAAAPHGTAAALELAIENVATATWLSGPDSVAVQMHIAAALHAADAQTRAPVSNDELQRLATDHGDEPMVQDTVAVWLKEFADTAGDAWEVVEPFASEDLPGSIRAALSDFAQRLDADARFVLIEQALARTVRGPVHRSFFQAARLSEVPARRVADRLAQLLAEAEDATAWQAILDLWQQLGPSSEAVQRRLVDDVYLPLITRGDQALDLTLSYFGLVANVKNVRKRVMAAFARAARTDDQKRRVDKLLLEAKWKRKSFFGLGPAVERDA